MSSEEALAKIEGELSNLKDELKVCQEAKTMGEACTEIINYCEKEGEPFSTDCEEKNVWHTNPSKGGGCTIL